MDVAEAKMIAAAAKPASRRAQRGSAPTSRRNPQVSSVGFGRERRPSSITGCPNPPERSGLVFLEIPKSVIEWPGPHGFRPKASASRATPLASTSPQSALATVDKK